MESKRVQPQLITDYRSLITEHRSPTITLIILWVLAMIGLPIMKWVWGRA
ncbi:MAG: hypothetical protein IPJ90_04215 [Anaerolineaceae bacterium]|nr:hypothetical protein [Anaerolineaceae bacterium]